MDMTPTKSIHTSDQVAPSQLGAGDSHLGSVLPQLDLSHSLVTATVFVLPPQPNIPHLLVTVTTSMLLEADPTPQLNLSQLLITATASVPPSQPDLSHSLITATTVLLKADPTQLDLSHLLATATMSVLLAQSDPSHLFGAATTMMLLEADPTPQPDLSHSLIAVTMLVPPKVDIILPTPALGSVRSSHTIGKS